jgi:hypothetical protein
VTRARPSAFSVGAEKKRALEQAAQILLYRPGMSEGTLRILGVAGALLFVSSSGWVALQLGPYLGQRHLHDLEWMSAASTNDQREAAHEALQLWGGDLHEAFCTLARVGDASSLPLLERAMKREPEEPLDCTWGHGEAAIRRVRARVGLK